jgi:hypothetical protein
MMVASFSKLMDDVVCSEMNVGAASSARVANDGMIN